MGAIGARQGHMQRHAGTAGSSWKPTLLAWCWSQHCSEAGSVSHFSQCSLWRHGMLRGGCRPVAALFAIQRLANPPTLPVMLFCAQGIKNVPNRLRIVVQRKRNEDDEDSVSQSAVGGAASQPGASVHGWQTKYAASCCCWLLGCSCTAASFCCCPMLHARAAGNLVWQLLVGLPHASHVLTALPTPPSTPPPLQEEMFSLVTLAEDQNTKKGVVVLEA